MSTKTRNLLLGLSVLCGLSILLNIFQLKHSSNNDNNNAALDTTLIQEQVAKQMRNYDKEVNEKYKKKFEKLEELVESNNTEELNKQFAYQNQSFDLTDQLNNIISLLEQLKVMSAGKNKDVALGNVKQKFEGLADQLKQKGANDAEIKQISGWMTNPIAKEGPGDKEEGHYTAIINGVNNIKQKL